MPTMSICVHKNLQKAHEYKLQITNFVICKILYFHNFQLEKFISQTPEQFTFNELNDNIN